jgi:nucleoside-diphosphate-sugar epimerase
VRVLLLGGTGLISTAIVAQLVERDVEVHVWNRGLSEDRLPAMWCKEWSTDERYTGAGGPNGWPAGSATGRGRWPARVTGDRPRSLALAR